MTTIAYHYESGTIAFDGRETEDGVILCDDTLKMRRVGEDVWFFCGTVSDEKRAIEYLQAEDPKKPRFAIDFEALIARPDGAVFQASICPDTGQPWRAPLNHNAAIGSGRYFALAAMDRGKSAEDAVRYAMTRDCGSGGEVRVFSVKEMKLL